MPAIVFNMPAVVNLASPNSGGIYLLIHGSPLFTQPI
jgi:hypothetical protein